MANDLRALQAAIAGEPTNQQIDELWDEVASYFHLYDEARELVREALARWGPRTALAEGAGAGPTDEELIAFARSRSPWREWMESDGSLANAHFELAELLRAAISRYGTTHPRPIPVAERPWERQGFCDAKGRCWWLNPTVTVLPIVWWLVSVPQNCTCGVMLPAAAIPLPEA